MKVVGMYRGQDSSGQEFFRIDYVHRITEMAVVDGDSLVGVWTPAEETEWLSFMVYAKFNNAIMSFKCLGKKDIRLCICGVQYLLCYEPVRQVWLLNGQPVFSCSRSVKNLLDVVLLCASIEGVYRLTLFMPDWYKYGGYLNFWFDTDACGLLCYSEGLSAGNEIYLVEGADKVKYEALLGMIAKSVLLGSKRIY